MGIYRNAATFVSDQLSDDDSVNVVMSLQRALVEYFPSLPVLRSHCIPLCFERGCAGLFRVCQLTRACGSRHAHSVSRELACLHVHALWTGRRVSEVGGRKTRGRIAGADPGTPAQVQALCCNQQLIAAWLSSGCILETRMFTGIFVITPREKNS